LAPARGKATFGAAVVVDLTLGSIPGSSPFFLATVPTTCQNATMSNTPPSTSEMAQAVMETLKALPRKLPGEQGNRAWTKQLAIELGNLGRQHEWGICTPGGQGAGDQSDFEAGWLYDLVWYRSPEGHLAEVYLVLESEWSYDEYDIRYDFEKLLLAKATLKVMVFQAGESEMEARFALLERGIDTFRKRSTDETYILAGLKVPITEFVFRQIQ